MLVLASRSPQRRAILEQLGVSFTVVEPDAREGSRGEPGEVVMANALAKARSVKGDLRARRGHRRGGRRAHLRQAP